MVSWSSSLHCAGSWGVLQNETVVKISMPRKRFRRTTLKHFYSLEVPFYRLISLEVAISAISAISDFPISLYALGIAEIAKIAGVLIY